MNPQLCKLVESFLSFIQKLLITHWPALLLLLLGVYIPLQIFGELAEEVWENEGGFPWDVPMLLAIHRTASHPLDEFATIFTQFGVFWGVFPVATALCLWLLLQRRWRSLSYVLTTLLGSILINRIAKVLLHRVRPHLWSSPAPELDYGFPSGHAMSSMTFVVVLIVLAWSSPWRWPVILGGSVFVLGIGWTRLYLGVHYPSDILAGWMVSVAWAVGVNLLLKPNRRPQNAPPPIQSAYDDRS